MSRPTRPPEISASAPAADPGAPPWALGVALLLAVGYSPLAHWANASGRSELAVLAGVALVLMLLIEPIARLRWWAWLLAAALLSALVPLWHSPRALLLLTAPPVVFTGWVAWFFGRSLRAGRTPLITRIVSGLYAQAGQALSSAQRVYTRRLTLCWAGLLAGMTVVNLLLGLWAVPGGVLAQLGRVPPLAIADEQASLFANLLSYGVIGGFFVGEYMLRSRWFPVRPYRNFLDFARQMARLGPAFWRDVLR
ncbi:ketosynthase [Pseudoxanthomonas sp.]|uniref:ketosynthase n=1 Tax=Pseudoxanthomonas sp. TaxID=1871049 RepID=UPI0026236FC2|nr:ketosynthase [Pseudoxanthomonas sp.]WDS35408.1 MAG: ketosynthase [Pseudoxanthomonas sp.]